jgi:uncharacterized sulfatase
MVSADTSPNIIFIHVDELRFPMNFPQGVASADGFMARFMPYTHRLLWQRGARFTNHHTAAADCTPSRAAFVTGLYGHQTYVMCTRASTSNPQGTSQPQPALDPVFPTYGKLLREIGYDTPYIGKWHLSDCPASATSSAMYDYLQPYGFQGLTVPDPVGFPGQGVGATLSASPPVGSSPPLGDAQIAAQATGWLQDRAASGNNKPFCLTVGFINPHDKQFFWGGPEAKKFHAVYDEQGNGEQPSLDFNITVLEEADPPDFGFGIPANWESAQRLQDTSPKLHSVVRSLFAYFTGAISDDPNSTGFELVPALVATEKHSAQAPYSYWAKSQNMYAQVILDVDRQVGQVVENLPTALLENTIVVFTADHGEYAGAHGLQGKGGTVYKECIQVPLIVADFTGRYVRASETDRSQLTSSVDLLPLLVSLARGGTGWMESDEWAPVYGNRAKLFDILKDPSAPGRQYALHTTDEVIPETNNYLRAPEHTIGVVAEAGKLGTYAFWKEGTSDPETLGLEVEYYDYTVPNGYLELQNTPDSPAALELRRMLFDQLIETELQAPLPEQYQAAQANALAAYWKYVKLANISGFITSVVD